MRPFIAVLVAFFALFFSGCASMGVPSISVSTSEPIFVMTKDQNATVFLNLKNSANGDESIKEDVAREFSARGFRVVSQPAGADFVVFGDIQSFERHIHREYNPRFFSSIGYGYGRPFWGFGARFGFPFDDEDYYRTRYHYILNASVLVRSKNADEKSTNITLTHGASSYSKSYVWPYFKQRLARQIASFFYFDTK